jgi:hypothetical protein
MANDTVSAVEAAGIDLKNMTTKAERMDMLTLLSLCTLGEEERKHSKKRYLVLQMGPSR